MGGENAYRQTVPGLGLGSPPRGRGKVYLGPQLGAGDGITPAWAGKSANLVVHGVLVQDHPRTGGERSGMKGMKSWKLGSPPRGRGKATHFAKAAALCRITPAWAGKRCCCPTAASRSGDHPRTGGEKGSYRWVIKSVKGSPPHKRGKVDVLFGGLVDGRITPAQAGKGPRRGSALT